MYFLVKSWNKHNASQPILHLFRALSYIGAGSDRCASIHPNLIHPTAVIHPDATLGQGLTIGPFCTVGSSVKLGDFCKLYPGSHVLGDTQLGENCILMVGAVVGDEIPGRTSIGSNNIIGHHAVVGIKCQDLKYKVFFLLDT
ncbi:hypothetical protein Droror1_Dr00000764 [Drosera rotundifolia]